jgi:hypothetical protein
MYGRHGDKWAEKVTDIVNQFSPSSILDYGCGQGALARSVPYRVHEYDPAIPDKSHLPSPADLVICTDVLEHIEPSFLDNVLNHIEALTQHVLFAVVSTRPAKKVLEDGRNAHLIVEQEDFWRVRFKRRFEIAEWKNFGDEFAGIFLSRK